MITRIHSRADRRRSYELLASAWDVPGAATSNGAH